MLATLHSIATVAAFIAFIAIVWCLLHQRIVNDLKKMQFALEDDLTVTQRNKDKK